MKNCDPRRPTIFITYFDMNNLYGWTMSRYFPYATFKQLKNADNFDLNLISEKSPILCILEVDDEYPDKLHALHNNYPLVPESLAIPFDMLSDYCKKVGDEYEIKVGDVKKLMPNLGNITNYVPYYKNLQLYLSLGIKMTKILSSLTG